MYRKLCQFILVVVSLSPGNILQAGEEVEKIIRDVANTYKNLSSYQEEFAAVVNVEMAGMKTELKIEAYPALIFIDRERKVQKIQSGFTPDLKKALEKDVDSLLKSEPLPADEEWTLQTEGQERKQSRAEKWYLAQRKFLLENYNRFGVHNASWDKYVEKFLELVARNQFKVLPSAAGRDILQAAERAISAGCSDPLILAYYGLNLIHAHRFEEAQHAYEESLRVLDKSAYSESVEACKEAIRIKLDYARAHFSLGLTYLDLKRYDEAIESNKEAIRIKPDHATTYCNLACSYSLLNDIDKAVEAMRKALALGYDDFEHLSEDADLENLRKDPRYKELISKAPLH